MIPYILNIFVMILFAVILLWENPNKWKKIVFCILVSLQWTIISGFRHISIGSDTYSYKAYFFDKTLNIPWHILLKDFINIIFYGDLGKDPGYILFEKFFQVFSDEYQLYLIFIASIFTFSLGVWIYKNSSEPFLSFLIYVCLFFSFFGITGHRQTIATALVVLIGYKFIKDKKFWPFFILVIIGSTLHKSALIFLVFYFMANKKITKKYLGIMSLLITLVFLFKNQIIIFVGTLSGYDSYIDQFEGAGTWIFTAALILVALVTFWKRKAMMSNNSQVTHYINAILIALLLVPLTFVDPSAMRVVQYFSLFLLLLIPEIIKTFSSWERTIIYYSVAVLLILLFAKNNPQYLFFWEGIMF
ncbi:EpsG family protein [Planococcus kocurii]|uniref:EpsG family protein n=1 Tax=Planococcus kocurii TaxID=1374 RepID=UPI003D035E18